MEERKKERILIKNGFLLLSVLRPGTAKLEEVCRQQLTAIPALGSQSHSGSL